MIQTGLYYRLVCMKVIGMDNKIQETQKRITRYDYVDGTPDMSFGGLFLLMTICFTIFAAFPRFAGSIFAVIIVWVVFAGGGILLGWLPQKLKERVTYPRTGYVNMKSQGRPIKTSTKLLIRIGLPLLTIVLLVILFLNRSKFPAQNPTAATYMNPGLMGFLFNVILAILGWKIRLWRYFVISAAGLLLSILFLFRVPSGNLGMALLSGMMSLIMFISGVATFWKYLHNNPSPQNVQPAE